MKKIFWSLAVAFVLYAPVKIVETDDIDTDGIAIIEIDDIDTQAV